MERILQRMTQNNLHSNVPNTESEYQNKFLAFKIKRIAFLQNCKLFSKQCMYNFRMKECNNNFLKLIGAELEKQIFVTSK